MRGLRGLYVMNANASDLHRVRGNRGNASPAWSPDSRWIATTDDGAVTGGVWVVPAEGGRTRRLVRAGQPAGVSWGP
jgi:Tol biopolymer transport system component